MGGKNVMANKSDFFAQNGSTEFKVVTSTGDVIGGRLYFGNSTNSSNIAFGSTGMAYSQGAPANYAEILYLSSGGLDVSTCPPYGLTYIETNSTGGDWTTSVRVLTMGNPIKGVQKKIVFGTTAAAANNLDIYLGTGAEVVCSSNKSTDAGCNYIGFSTLNTECQSVTLIGLSSALWLVTDSQSTTPGINAVGGITLMTTARTSG